MYFQALRSIIFTISPLNHLLYFFYFFYYFLRMKIGALDYRKIAGELFLGNLEEKGRRKRCAGELVPGNLFCAETKMISGA